MDQLNHLQPPFVLLENSLQPKEGGDLFESPHEIITASSIAEIEPAFGLMEAAIARGDHLAGYMTYELGLALEPKLAGRLKEPVPLLWFGAFRERQRVSHAEITSFLDSASPALTTTGKTTTGTTASNANLTITPSQSYNSYLNNFNKVKANIAAGDIYQLNLTFKADITNAVNPLDLYARMRRAQPVAFGSLIMTGDRTILSASPELFVESRDGWLETRPMKGTLKRGPRLEEEMAEQTVLASDEKSRAENLMIVDLMRNDLSRIAEPGTVSVEDLFKVETYRSLHQMISVIRARQNPAIGFFDQMRALLPPGSITGAPKIRAMELINELEQKPRGLYTGAIGFLSPKRDYVFNVAIRTIELDADGSGEIGIGSGLVHDSKARDEYDECLLKMKFLEAETPDFQLIETIGYFPGEGLVLLDEHMQRLQSSARYFNYQLDQDRLVTDLTLLTDQAAKPLRIRILLNESGATTITPVEISRPLPTDRWNITVAKTPMHSENPYLYHKTTHRAFYDDARFAAQKERRSDTVHEVIFINERGEITEGSFTNIFIDDQSGPLKTPPVSAGLLPGTLRASLLKVGKATEARLTITDLENAEKIYVGNSVRGLIRARLV